MPRTRCAARAAEEPGFHPYDELDPLWDELGLGDRRAGKRAASPGLLFEETPEPIAGDQASILVQLLGPAPVSPDGQSGLSIRAVNGILVELELAGQLVRHAGNGVSLNA